MSSRALRAVHVHAGSAEGQGSGDREAGGGGGQSHAAPASLGCHLLEGADFLVSAGKRVTAVEFEPTPLRTGA